MYNCSKEFFVGAKVIKLRQDEEYITLQSLLKLAAIIPTGGMIKVFLEDNVVLVNGERENRRGCKLYRGDEVSLTNALFVIK